MGGQHLPPDHSKGDEKTIGGYMAVHDRPAAFEGVDGLSYSVSIEADETGDPSAPFGAFLVFVRWGAGEPSVTGHLETDFLVRAATADAARAAVGAFPLGRVKQLLDSAIRERRPLPTRPWWEVMHDEADEGGV